MKKLVILAVIVIIGIGVISGIASLINKASEPKNQNTPVYYEITYELNGGEATGLQARVRNDNEYVLPEATKSGFKFCGWYETSGFSGNPVTKINSGNKSDVKLYAKFLKEFKATYITDGGSQNNVKNYTSEDVIELTGAKKSGYVFLGWYEDADFSGSRISAISNRKSDITLYAKYSIAYRIYYDLDGGENNADNPLEFCEEDNISLQNPTKRGMAFLGWFDENDKRVTNIYRGTTNDIEVKAKWEIATYKITWDIQNGQLGSPLPTQYTYGVGVSEKDIPYPTKQGMVFAGWYVDRNGASEYIKSISADDYGDMKIYAKWVDEVALSRNDLWAATDIKTKAYSSNVAYETNGITVSVPEELMHMYNEGRLGLSISGTFYANVRSQGNATGYVSAYMIINGNEHYVCGSAKKGGGYSYFNGFWTVPLNGDWGVSGSVTNTQNIPLASTETVIGYRYTMSSDKTNDEVETTVSYKCQNLVCKFYIV